MAGRSAAVLAATGALALALATSAEAACPRLIVVDGQRSAEPIAVGDWDAACELYVSFLAGAPLHARLEGRPSIRLGLFWNSHVWEPHVRNGRVGELRPDHADQLGRFYPAVGGGPALVVVPGAGDWPRAVGEVGLRILEAHGVDVRSDDDGAAAQPWFGIALIAAAVLALALLLLRRASTP